MLHARLSAMMFLQFFVWGSWYATTGNFMAAHGMAAHIHWAYTVGPLAGLLSPFFLGLVADRFFPTEHVLGTLGVLGALPLWLAAGVEAGASSQFVGLLLAHTLCFFPTVGLASALAFHHLTDRERHFPRIRLFGTLGWIAAGGIVSGWLVADATALPLRIAAGGCLVFGLYCFTLPHTPPPAAGRALSMRQLLGLDAIQRLASVPFFVFLLCDVVVAIPYALYYAYVPVYMQAAGIASPAFAMTWGQWTEVIVMALLPLAFRRLGIKWMVVIGMALWGVRYGLLALAADAPLLSGPLIYSAILLHGVCFTLVYIAAQVYLDRRATPDIRGQAQGLLVTVRSGIGMLMGAQLGGVIFNRIVGGDVTDMAAWQTLWLVPVGITFVMTLVMMRFFYDDSLEADEAEVLLPAN